MTTPLTFSPANLLTSTALPPAIFAMIIAAKCAEVCHSQRTWNTTAVINGLAAAAFAGLSVMYSLATSDILVRSFAFASQAAILPWAVGLGFALVAAPCIFGGWKKAGNQYPVIGFVAVTLLTLAANGFD